MKKKDETRPKEIKNKNNHQGESSFESSEVFVAMDQKTMKEKFEKK